MDVEERLKAIEKRLDALERPTNVPGSSRLGDLPGAARRLFLEKKPQSDNDKTLLAAYYIETHLGKKSFNFDDIERFFDEIKEPVPANRRDPPYQNVAKGYFRKIGSTKQGKTARNTWALTNDGISRVEGGFAPSRRR